jgi:peptidoglycan/xylan/chitin deacetylase (PgdA/CDA1 family)
MAESADFLRRRLNKDVKYLAYPYGDTNSLVIGLLKKLGYRGAFTVKRGSNPSSVHHYRIQRSMIYGHFDLQEFSRNLAHFDSRAWDPPMQTSGR